MQKEQFYEFSMKNDPNTFEVSSVGSQRDTDNWWVSDLFPLRILTIPPTAIINTHEERDTINVTEGIFTTSNYNKKQ